MPPIADDATAPAPTIKPPPKKRPTKTRPTIIGPTAPTVSPTRVSKPSKKSPVIGPVAPKLQAPTPTYTNEIFTRKAPVGPTRTIPNKSSGDISDFIQGLKQKAPEDIVSGTVAEDEPEYNFDATSFLLNPQRTADEVGYAQDHNKLLGRQADIQDFLQKIRPQNYDPEYGGPTLPEAWKHRKNDPSKPLKPHWDAQAIADNLKDFENSYPSEAAKAMNDILYKQMMNQSNWVKRQTEARAYRVSEFLNEASDDAFDGDFNTLAEKLEKNPDFLEFASYKDEYTVGPDDIWNQWMEERNKYNDDKYMKGAMRDRTDQTKSHYEYVRGYYTKAQKVANRAIKKYEDKYNESVEFAEKAGGKKAALAKAAGPAIPEPTNTDKSLLDMVGASNPEQKGSRFFEGDREAAKSRLGVKKLPSVKDMLAAMVSQGQIDPDNDAEINAWIRRLQNPNHPDTRAMYVAFARNENKNLDLKGDALDFINEPINSYLAGEQKKAEEKAAAQVKGAELGEKAALPFALEMLKEPWNAFDKEAIGQNAAESLVKAADDKDTKAEKSVGAMFWTFDKLSRASYAVAGATDAWYKLDKDEPTDARAWYDGIPDPIGILTGKNLADSTDEIWASPAKGAIPAVAGYQQFFRGSDLPGISKDLVPITFSQVIANQALRDPEDNIYDKSWYQHTAGFILDVGTDPLNFVGIGAVNTTMKIPARASMSLARNAVEGAVTPAKFLRELNAPNKSAIVEKVNRIQQTLARQGDLAHGDALITESGARPFEFTVEYTKNSAPVGNAGSAPEYTNARFFTNTKADAAEINQQIKELSALKTNYPTQVALESHKIEIQKIVDDLDLGGSISVPELRVRTLMEQNSTPIRVEGVEGLKLSNPGGQFWQRVLNPLEDATAKWPGHKSRTKFAEFEGRLTQRAAAAKRALDEEETFSRIGSIPPNEVAGRWQKALDEAGDIDPNTGKPAMWQEYDVEHFLDEGAPGLIPNGGWSPLKAYAKASGLTEKEFSRFWSNEDIIRSLVRGPELLRKSDPEYSGRIDAALSRIRYSKEKLSNTTDPTARANAYKALAMGYRSMSEATLEGSFRYLDSIRKGSITKTLGEPAQGSGKIDTFIEQGDAELEASYSAVDDITPYIGGGDEGGSYFDGTYSGINIDDFDTFKQALNSVDSASFSSPSAQVQSLLDELASQKSQLSKGTATDVKMYTMSETQVIELDKILPIKSQFRKANGDFDTEAITRALTHNKTDIVKDNSAIFKVSYKLTKPTAADDSVEMARYSREARFLDTIAKEVEDNANKLFQTEKTAIVASKTSNKPLSEGLQSVEDEIASFWVTRDVSKPGSTEKKLVTEGPAVRRLGPKPTRKDLEKEHPLTFQHERAKSQADRNKKRNIESVDIDRSPHLKSKPNRTVPWDASQGMAKTAAERRIEAVVKGKQRRWEKARKTAQETDAARFKELNAERSKLRASDEDFKLTIPETQTIYRTAFKKAVDEVIGTVEDTKTLLAKGANSRLTVGDTTSSLHKQAADMIKFEELKLKIAKAEATLPEELLAIELKRKVLVKKKIALYDRVKKAKFEANTVRLTMQHRIGEEHILQALQMPERMDAKVLQLHIFGMKKNLQFTSSMFKGAEFAEKFLPAKVWASYQDNWVRPTKQLETPEGINIRANMEGKTPVVIHALQKKLTKAMSNATENERSGMLMAYRRGIPYGGPKQLEFQNIAGVLDEIMDIINGSHHGFMFKGAGKTEAEPLGLYEILRYLPEEYSFNLKTLHRMTERDDYSDEIRSSVGNDPFSPAPEPRTNFTLDHLMQAIESNGKSTPKDLIDPFRLAGVYQLAAGQASQLRALKKSISETFGVVRPTSPEKAKLWLDLERKHGWESRKEIPNALFPPEIVKEVDTLLKFTQPGPEQAALTKVMDQAIGYWKQGMTIYNPAYYTRNGIGEVVVSALDGVMSPKWYRMAHRVTKYEKKTDLDLSELVQRYDVLEGKIPVDVVKGNEILFSLKGGLKVRVEDVLKGYIDMGLKSTFVNTDLDKGVRGLANQSLTSNPIRKGIAKTNNKVHEVGEGFEDYLRMAHFMHAMEHSGKGSLKESMEYAATRVRRSHFDYTDFSHMEKTVMLRAFPFYKWIRRGAPLMMQHVFMTPGKMMVAPKAMDAMSGLGVDPMNLLNEGPVLDTQDVYEDKNGHLPNYTGIAPAWIRDLFSYQMQPAADDEYANFFRVSLPQYDGLQGILSLAEGNFGDSPINTLMNPMIKAPLELGMNKSLDPDNNFEIYGGEYNENMGISDPEAIGAYAARTANPWSAFLAKLSKNGKLPDGMNISDKESNRDATRDVASFITGLGFYQSKLGYDGPVPESSPAVGQVGLSQVPKVSGRAALNPDKKNDDVVKKLIEATTNIESGESATGDSAKTWTDFGDKKSGWIPNKYGKKGSGWIPNKYGSGGSGSGGFSGSGGSSYSGSATWELLELLRTLKDELDAGRVIDPEFNKDL